MMQKSVTPAAAFFETPTWSSGPPPALPTPTPEQKRIAAENFDRARQVLLTGNHDYGISLLVTCCKMDPANFFYRQAGIS